MYSLDQFSNSMFHRSGMNPQGVETTLNINCYLEPEKHHRKGLSVSLAVAVHKTSERIKNNVQITDDSI